MDMIFVQLAFPNSVFENLKEKRLKILIYLLILITIPFKGPEKLMCRIIQSIVISTFTHRIRENKKSSQQNH